MLPLPQFDTYLTHFWYISNSCQIDNLTHFWYMSKLCQKCVDLGPQFDTLLIQIWHTKIWHSFDICQMYVKLRSQINTSLTHFWYKFDTHKIDIVLTCQMHLVAKKKSDLTYIWHTILVEKNKVRFDIHLTHSIW